MSSQWPGGAVPPPRGGSPSDAAGHAIPPELPPAPRAGFAPGTHAGPPAPPPAPAPRAGFAPDASRPAAPAPRPRALHEQPAPPRPTKRRRRGINPAIPIVIGVIVLALLAGAGVLIWRALQPDEVTAPPSGPATHASDAVAGYLHALARGDLETALSYGQAPPTDLTFITQEVLDHSRAVAPIGNIVVREVKDPNAFEVSADYTIGDQPVTTRFRVIHDGEKWLLLETVGRLSIADLRQKNLPVVVNGVPAGSSNELSVLPGGYTFTTGLDRIGYPDQVVTVSAPDSRQSAPDLAPVLTDVGRADLIDAAKADLAQCLTSTQLNPAGCPFGARLPEGSTAEKVAWQLVGDPFAEADPTLEWTDHGLARLPVQVRVLLKVTVRTGNSTGRTEEQLTRNATAEGDILGDPLHITWRQ